MKFLIESPGGATRLKAPCIFRQQAAAGPTGPAAFLLHFDFRSLAFSRLFTFGFPFGA